MKKRAESTEPSPVTYEMIGSQELRLPDQSILPGSGEFSAVIDPAHEDFLVRAGVIRRKE